MCEVMNRKFEKYLNIRNMVILFGENRLIFGSTLHVKKRKIRKKRKRYQKKKAGEKNSNMKD
jgi:hypothetical protein